MKRKFRYFIFVSLVVAPVIFFSSCKDYLNPEQELYITENKLLNDWYEYRSLAMGMYGLQQDLVEQLMILGELRADLLTITPNADPDMVEIYNFRVTKENKYAKPDNFFKLIAASNNFIRLLEKEHPEVMDPKSAVNNFDRLYGEALCMRAWAYFNAVRIYGKVPFIHESLVTINEIEDYVNSSGTYIDSVHVVFGRNGYSNDTTKNVNIKLEKKYYDTDLVISYFTNELEKKVKAVGVNHYINNSDNTWEVTIWSTWAYHALLGQMYLTQGNYVKAVSNFEYITFNTSEERRYHLDATFSNASWRNIFRNIDVKEDIYAIWFNKANFQQNRFQDIFEPIAPHQYMLKPTKAAVMKWECIFDNYSIIEDTNFPWKSRIGNPGIPGDLSRGYGVSYAYVKDEQVLPESTVRSMLILKREKDFRTAQLFTADHDTVVWKYSIGKDVYAQDANFRIFRAAGIHLYLAEIYNWWSVMQGGILRNQIPTALNVVNNGAQYSPLGTRPEMGVRGRVGFGGTMDGIKIANINYIHNPYTNEIVSYFDYTGNLEAKQLYFEDQVIEEKARELAFEGERFYDLMRIAKRRMMTDPVNGPDFLASKVAQKYPAAMQKTIHDYLMIPQNWYIHYFE
jgi:starch-binding outer membrane protein, SusD/RagB family